MLESVARVDFDFGYISCQFRWLRADAGTSASNTLCTFHRYRRRNAFADVAIFREDLNYGRHL